MPTPETKAPWELDPTERGLPEPTDLIDYLPQYNRCQHCHLLGRSTVDFCAAELPLTDLRAKTMLMRTCETAIKTYGDASQPRHGRKKPVATLVKKQPTYAGCFQRTPTRQNRGYLAKAITTIVHHNKTF